MYFHKNEQKKIPIENYQSGNDNGNKKNCPILVFIILGILSMLVGIWLIYSIIQDNKKN